MSATQFAVAVGNLGFFVAFLVSLATLATFLAACCVLYFVQMWSPPSPMIQLVPLSWRWGLALLVGTAAGVGMYKCLCSRDAGCDAVVQLVLLMPGSRFGATLVALGTYFEPRYFPPCTLAALGGALRAYSYSVRCEAPH